MKYFTPQLYVRLQDPDPTAMDAADVAWQRAEEQYARHVKSIRPKLSPSVLELLDQTRLHDADVLWMGGALPFFGILVRLDAPPYTTMLLNYFLTSPPQVDKQALPPEHCSAAMQWMYDEFDLASDHRPGFKHSILFSNGWQVMLSASEVHLATLDTVYAPSDSVVTV